MLADGVLSEKDYNKLKELTKQNNEVNLGYAFVTFSHTDEAKLALILL